MAAASVRTPLYSLGSVRLPLCLILMVGLFFTISMRINLGMSMVCMVNSTAFLEPRKPSAMIGNTTWAGEKTCRKRLDGESLKDSGYHGTLLWSPPMQSLLFSATFYGTIITIVPSGFVADRWPPKAGPKALLIFAVLEISIMTLLASRSFYVFFAARVVMGLGEGFMIPSICSFAARWFPPAERGAMAALYTSGIQLAGTFGGVISASLCSLEFLGGWSLIFYLFGGLGLIWCVLFVVVSSDSPKENRWISEEEKQFIITSLPHTPGGSKMATVPWREMLTSMVVISNLIAQFGINFSLTTMQSYLPAYFRDVLLLDLNNNGLYTVLPFLSQLVFKNVLVSSPTS